MCTTIDGKILVDRWGRLPGGQSGSALFEKTAARVGIPSWLVGTHTMAEFASKRLRLKRASAAVPAGDYIANAAAKRFAVGADARGILRFSDNTIEGDHVVLLVTKQVSNDYLAHLRAAQVSYVICGRKRLNLHDALSKLYSLFGIQRLMLQGGGTFNGAMLKAGLVDEVSQVIVPVVDGGPEVTSIFDIPGAKTGRAAGTLKLTQHRTLDGGVVWLRYKLLA
jgi:riboflavin biosynthesis pyrimidine reductase